MDRPLPLWALQVSTMEIQCLDPSVALQADTWTHRVRLQQAVMCKRQVSTLGHWSCMSVQRCCDYSGHVLDILGVCDSCSAVATEISVTISVPVAVSSYGCAVLGLSDSAVFPGITVTTAGH